MALYYTSILYYSHLQKNTGQNGGKPKLDLNVAAAWAQGVTGKNITTAIMDDGVDYMHPDLINNYVSVVVYSSNCRLRFLSCKLPLPVQLCYTISNYYFDRMRAQATTSAATTRTRSRATPTTGSTATARGAPARSRAPGTTASAASASHTTQKSQVRT